MITLTPTGSILYPKELFFNVFDKLRITLKKNKFGGGGGIQEKILPRYSHSYKPTSSGDGCVLFCLVHPEISYLARMVRI